jgi:hypothetical protein
MDMKLELMVLPGSDVDRAKEFEKVGFRMDIDGIHEAELGRSDPEWPQWYAEHMARTLTEDGYRLSREG